MKGAAVIVIVTEEVHATTRNCLTLEHTLKSKLLLQGGPSPRKPGLG